MSSNTQNPNLVRGEFASLLETAGVGEGKILSEVREYQFDDPKGGPLAAVILDEVKASRPRLGKALYRQYVKLLVVFFIPGADEGVGRTEADAQDDAGNCLKLLMDVVADNMTTANNFWDALDFEDGNTEQGQSIPIDAIEINEKPYLIIPARLIARKDSA